MYRDNKLQVRQVRKTDNFFYPPLQEEFRVQIFEDLRTSETTSRNYRWDINSYLLHIFHNHLLKKQPARNPAHSLKVDFGQVWFMWWYVNSIRH